MFWFKGDRDRENAWLDMVEGKVTISRNEVKKSNFIEIIINTGSEHKDCELLYFEGVISELVLYVYSCSLG